MLTAGGACFAQEGKPAAVAGVPAAAARPAPFLVSKETTWFTEPVRADGTVDYMEALNRRLGAGATKENNAAITLLEAIGRGRGDRVENFDRVRAKLGMAALAGARPGAGAAAGGAEYNGGLPAVVQSGPWTAEKAPEVARWLKSQDASLNLLVEAATRDHYFMPMVRTREGDYLFSTLLPHLIELRDLANALKARAMLALGNEDGEGFRRDVVALVRVGRLMTRGATLVEWMVAAGVEHMGLEGIEVAASGGWLSAAQVGEVLDDLREGPAGLAMAEVFDPAERTFPLEVLQACAAHGPAELARALEGTQVNVTVRDEGPDKDWSAALRKVNAWYDRASAARRKATHTERMAAAKEVRADLDVLVAKNRREAKGGVEGALEDRLIVEVMPSLDRVEVRQTRLRIHRELAEVALALSAFRAKAGEYPGGLAELTPAYLKAAPVDLFIDRPLAYRVEGAGYVLQSVGPNARDDAGTAGAGNDDLVVRAER
jgi:hypothetical protein